MDFTNLSLFRAPILIVLVLLMALTQCEKIEKDSSVDFEDTVAFFQSLPLCDREYQLIAYSGDLCLDVELFKTQYVAYASVASVRDSQKSRLLFLEEIMNRMAIAQWAETNNLLSDESIQMNLEGHLRVQTAKKWVQDQVRSLVSNASNEEVRNAFRKKNTRLELAQIFSQNEADIINYERRLQNGEDFSSLAKESMLKVGEDSSRYYMGWIGWKDMGIGPENAAYSLEIGEISAPTPSLNGWHMFLLMNKEERFFADLSTFENERQSLSEAIFARRIEERSQAWVDSVRKQYPLELYSSALGELEQWLGAQNLQLSPYLIQEKARLEIQNRTFEFNEETTLASIGPFSFTTKDFLIALPHIPNYLLSGSLRGAIEFALTDYLFSQKALQEGYFNDTTVQNLLRLAKINALNTHAFREYTQTLLTSEDAPNAVMDAEWMINARMQLIQQLQPSLNALTVDTNALDNSLPYFF